MSIKNINTVEDHDYFIKNNDKCIMYFGSRSCPNCLNMNTVLNDVAVKYPNIKFSKVEVANTQVENLDGKLPILVCYKNHQPVGKVIGSDRENIINLIENNFNHNQMTELNTMDSLNEFISSNKNGVIFFGSEKCPHCRNIKPYIQDLEIKYKQATFKHVEIKSENQKMIPSQCKDKNGEWGLPLIVFYKNGKISNYVMGANREEINNMIMKELL